MMRSRPAQIVLCLLRVALGFIFLYAAWTKIPNLQQFAQETANYRLIPEGWVGLLSACMIGIEVLVSVALVLGFWSRAAATIVTLMLVMFIGMLSQAFGRGIDLECGCFGGTAPADWTTIVRDLFFLMLSVPVMLWGGGAFALTKSRTSGSALSVEPRRKAG